jgi:hypothetical protein
MDSQSSGQAYSLAKRTEQHVLDRNRLLPLVLIAAAVVYAWLIYKFLAPEASDWDISGYLNFARLLEQGELRAPVRALPGFSVTEFGLKAYQPGGFVIRDESSTLAPLYPVGLPLHFALATLLVGSSRAVAFVNIAAALSAACLMYVSCRHLKLLPVWALAATVTLCICPFFINWALLPMSDVPATTWALAALYAAMRSRERLSWVIICGSSAAVAALIRPTNMLLAFPILVAFGLQPARYFWAALGALPGGLVMSYVNWQLYGTPLTSGYVIAYLSLPFSIDSVPYNAAHFALWMFMYLSPLVACALALPFCPQARTRDWAVQAIWLVVLTSLYAMWPPAGVDWWWLRFLLPAIPASIMLAAGGLSGIWELFERKYQLAGQRSFELLAFKYIAAASLTVISIGWTGVASLHLSVFDQGYSKQFAAAAHWAQKHFPENALIICSEFSGALYYYTGFPIVRWDALREEKVKAFFEAAEAQRRPIYAILLPFELEDATRRLGGSWTKIAQIGQTSVLQLIR